MAFWRFSPSPPARVERRKRNLATRWVFRMTTRVTCEPHNLNSGIIASATVHDCSATPPHPRGTIRSQGRPPARVERRKRNLQSGAVVEVLRPKLGL